MGATDLVDTADLLGALVGEAHGYDGFAVEVRPAGAAPSGTFIRSTVACMPMTGRPLDVMEESLGETVTVHLKTGETYLGELGGYDQHMNLVLEPVPEDDNAEEEGGQTRVRVTTIIRGDNVVSIRP